VTWIQDLFSPKARSWEDQYRARWAHDKVAGVVTLFVGHLVPLPIPSQWQAVFAHRWALLTFETIGSAAAILCLAGLLVLLVRRTALRPRSAPLDFVVLAILIAQVALGLAAATLHRWGAVWSVGTTTPYLRSIVTLRPDPSLVAGVPLLVTLHLTGAWIVLALIPFTRLVHIFALPLQYLTRPPQKVVWARRRSTGS
jgi:nitrate reductase gamma subunit